MARRAHLTVAGAVSTANTARQYIHWISTMILDGTMPAEVMTDQTLKRASACLRYLGTPVVGFIPSALLAANGPPTPKGPSPLAELASIVPQLEESVTVCPACVVRDPERLFAVIVHLNDKHEWARERIADWLETLPVDLILKPLSKGN